MARCTSTVTSGEIRYKPLRDAAGSRGSPRRSAPRARQRRVRDVEEGLRGGVAVRRAEHARAQAIAGDDVGPVQGEVGDQLGRSPGPVGREILAQTVQAGHRREETHVDDARGPGVRPTVTSGGWSGSGLEARRRVRPVTGRHQLRNGPAGLFGLERGPHHPAHRVERRSVPVDQDGQIGRGRGRGGDDRGVRCHLAGEGAGVPEEDERSRQRVVRGRLGQEARIARVVRRQHPFRPRPGLHRGAHGPGERGCVLAEQGEHLSRSQRDQPGAHPVVPDRQDDGGVRVEGRRLPLVQSCVLDVPDAVPLRRAREGMRRRGLRPGEPERDTGRRDADGTEAGRRLPVDERAGQEAVGGLEGTERGDVPEAVQQCRGVDRFLGQRWQHRELAGEGLARATAASAPGQAGAGQRAQTERNELGQMAGMPGWRATVSGGAGHALVCASMSAGLPGDPAEIETPARYDVVRVDEAQTVPHDAIEVHRGERGPVRTVTEAIVRDDPQRLARPHRVGRRRGLRDAWRPQPGRLPVDEARRAGRHERRCRGRAGQGGHRQRSADRRQREHAHRDPRRDLVEDRGTPRRDLAPADVGRHRAEELEATGGPGHPGRERQRAEGVAIERAPRMTESTREGIAHHDDQDRGDCGEGQQHGEHRTRDIEEAPEATRCGRATTHRQGRS